MKCRQTSNQIRRLSDTNRHLLTTTLKIENEILSFYKNLLGSAAHTLSATDPDVMSNGYTRNRNQ